MPLDPARTVRELEELRELTGDANGAQRVAWTETWERGAGVAAREGLGHRRATTSATRRATSGSRCRGRSDDALLIGGHMDSVPNGGWLDGCLNVLAGVEVLRRIAEEGEPPVTVRLVDWADEEGARFGRSLFGSSAAAGLDGRPGRAREAHRSRRRRAAGGAARARHRALDARPSRGRSSRTRRPTSSCTSSRARCWSRWTCRSASCSARSASSARASPGAARPRTPARRRWTSAATRSPAPRSWRSRSASIAAEVGGGAVCTSGGVVCRPGIVTSVVETAEQLLDQRHLDAVELARMLELAKDASDALRRRGEHRGRLGADLADRADPLRRRADRARRRVDPRGRGHLAPPPVGPAARRRRGLARGRADGDALRPEPARPLAHAARGHEAGAPRAVGAGARPARLEDDRAARRLGLRMA